MGTVYLADRAGADFEHRVAIKLIGTSDADDPLHQRFLAERRILAGLVHPNIARLLDGGVTGDGRPYLVMELVDGLPITAYCADRNLDVPARLRLFADVCAAIQYAHQSLVIHRDLKPSNILVSGDGQVHLLDFGIAKLIDPARAVTETRVESRMMTPAYASPEQVKGEALGTTSDIYSLGVLLYELLCGSAPYEFPTTSPLQVATIVCEQDPPPPSARVAATDRRLAHAPRWRSRQHRPDGDAEGAGAPLRIGRHAAPGCGAASRRTAGAGASRQSPVSPAEVPAPAPRRSGRRSDRDRGARRRPERRGHAGATRGARARSRRAGARRIEGRHRVPARVVQERRAWRSPGRPAHGTGPAAARRRSRRRSRRTSRLSRRGCST